MAKFALTTACIQRQSGGWSVRWWTLTIFMSRGSLYPSSKPVDNRHLRLGVAACLPVEASRSSSEEPFDGAARMPDCGVPGIGRRPPPEQPDEEWSQAELDLRAALIQAAKDRLTPQDGGRSGSRPAAESAASSSDRRG